MVRWLLCHRSLIFWPLLFSTVDAQAKVTVALKIGPGEQKEVDTGFFLDWAEDTQFYDLDLTNITVRSINSNQKLTIEVVIGSGFPPIHVSTGGCCYGYQCCTGSEYALADSGSTFEGPTTCQIDRLGQTFPPDRSLRSPFKEFFTNHYSLTVSSTASRPLAGSDSGIPPSFTIQGDDVWIMASNCNSQNSTIILEGSFAIQRKSGFKALSTQQRRILFASFGLVLLYLVLGIWQSKIALQSRQSLTTSRILTIIIFLGLLQSVIFAYGKVDFFQLSSQLQSLTRLSVNQYSKPLQKWGMASWVTLLLQDALLRGLGLWLCTSTPSKCHTCSIGFATLVASLVRYVVVRHIDRLGKNATSFEVFNDIFNLNTRTVLVLNVIWFLWACVALCRSHGPNLLVPKRRLAILLATAFILSFVLHSTDTYFRSEGTIHGHNERDVSGVYLSRRYSIWVFQLLLVVLLNSDADEARYAIAAPEESIELAENTEKYRDDVTFASETGSTTL